MPIQASGSSVAPLFAVAGCVCFHGEHFLILCRSDDKSYPQCWGVPSGKVRDGETPIKAAIRELYEETRILLSSENLKLVDTFLISNNDMVFSYTMYYSEFSLTPDVHLTSTEHTEYRWEHFERLDALKLVPDVKETIGVAIAARDRARAVQLDLFTGQAYRHSPKSRTLEEYLGDFSLADRVNAIRRDWIVSFGPPGSGKTTALRKAQNVTPNMFLICDNSEIIKNDTLLKKYFEAAVKHHKHQYFFHCQLQALAWRFHRTIDCPDGSLVDETIFNTLGYSLALLRLQWISEEEFETFMYHYKLYLRYLPEPRLVLNFSCEPKTLEERTRKKRRRTSDDYFTPAYLSALSEAFREVSEHVRRLGFNIVTVNTENVEADKVAEVVIGEIRQLV